MANEIGPVRHTTGKAVYALLFQPSTGKVRDVVANAWDTYADADIGDYDIALTEQGTASGVYYGSLPTGLDGTTHYDALVYEDVAGGAGTPAVTDTYLGAMRVGPDPSNVTQISGDATAADTLELFVEALDQSTGQLDAGSFAAGAIAAATIATDAITAAQIATGAIAADEIAATAADKIADHILRRAFATAAASSDGDAKSGRSLLGAVAKLVNKVAVSSGTLSVYEADDSTALFTQTVSTDSTADPITGADTD